MEPSRVHKRHVRPKDRGRLRRRPVEQVLAEMIQTLFQDQPGPVVIAVGGPGGTGKSALARRLARRLGEADVLRLDDYKTARKARQRKGIFGAHPDANKMELIAEHVTCLRHGQAFEKPVYDPAIGDAGEPETYRPRRFNIVDGEVATYSRFRALVDLTIFIDSDWRTQLATRLGRDLDRRNYSPEKAIATFLHSNLREFGEHGAHSKSWADVHLFCHADYRLEMESVCEALYERVGALLHEDMEELELAGLIVPLLTPFGPDDTIDRQAFVEHLDWLSRAGVRRVLVGGLAGEGYTLAGEERMELLQLALEYFPGLILLQVGGPLGEAVQTARRAQDLGADAIVCQPPSGCADAPPEGLVEYFRRLHAAIDIPLILGNDPRHSPNSLTPEILQRLAPFGLHDATGDRSLMRAASRCFIDDRLGICRSLRAGAIGFVSPAANAVPELYVALDRCSVEHRWQAAIWLEARVALLQNRLGRHETAAIKHLLRARLEGYPVAVRPPLAGLPLEQGDLAAQALCEAMATEYEPTLTQGPCTTMRARR